MPGEIDINIEPSADGDGWTVETFTAGEVDKAVFYGPRAKARAQLFADMLRPTAEDDTQPGAAG